MNALSKKTILVVEDEVKIAAVLVEYLKGSGYETTHLDRGDLVLDWLGRNSPDLILLDLMLPGQDGLSLCGEIRKTSIVPIIMLTARVEEIDRLLGLKIGADDYICKPFSPREVVARVQAILRRVTMIEERAIRESPGEETSAHYRGLEIKKDNFQALIDGKVLDLTPVEFRMLALLASAPGRVYSRDRLMATIYEDGRVVSDRTVDSHVKNLRRKLRLEFGDDDVVHSIYGVGYKFE